MLKRYLVGVSFKASKNVAKYRKEVFVHVKNVYNFIQSLFRWTKINIRDFEKNYEKPKKKKYIVLLKKIT